MSFQVTILKVLAGSSEGCLAVADLRRIVAVLMTSGREWVDRTKRIASRAPDLDIFGQALIVRSPTGWRITPAGREFLAAAETSAQVSALPVPVPAVVEPPTAALGVPLIGIKTRRQRRGRRAGRKAARSAVA